MKNTLELKGEYQGFKFDLKMDLECTEEEAKKMYEYIGNILNQPGKMDILGKNLQMMNGNIATLIRNQGKTKEEIDKEGQG